MAWRDGESGGVADGVGGGEAILCGGGRRGGERIGMGKIQKVEGLGWGEIVVLRAVRGGVIEYTRYDGAMNGQIYEMACEALCVFP